jgi:hypothetical protein
MASVLERQLRRAQLFTAVQLAALSTLPFLQPSDGSALWQIVFAAALWLTLATVALLLTPTANKIVGQSPGGPTRSSERVLSAGRVALSLAAACTAFLLLDQGLAALLGPGLR